MSRHTQLIRAVCAAALFTLPAACGGTPSPPVTASAAPSTGVSEPAAPTTTRATVTSAPSTPAPSRSTTTHQAHDGRCGTVTSASGLTLRVMPGPGVTECALAERVVRRFHEAIAGKQPPDSHRPVAADVDGWHCVSGPADAGGGTQCQSGSREVTAATEDE